MMHSENSTHKRENGERVKSGARAVGRDKCSRQSEFHEEARSGGGERDRMGV